MEQPDEPGVDDDEWAKRQAKAEISRLKRLVEAAGIEEVDTPTGRKDVEIAWEDEDGFHVKEGTAIGVYREEHTVYKVEWEDGEMTAVFDDDLVDLEESDYYVDE